MATYGIHDPSIAAGFGALAQAMFPDPMKQVQASLFAAQRENQYSQVGYHDAAAYKTREEGDQIAQQIQGNIDLSKAVGPGFNPKDPEQRARALAATARTKDGLQHGPDFVMGASAVTDPNFVGQPDLSNMMAGTGKDYRTTPTGQQQALDAAHVNNQEDNAAAENVARIAADGRVDAAGLKGAGAGAKPPNVGPAQRAQFEKDVNSSLSALLAGKGGYDSVDPVALNDLVQGSIANYQANGQRNAPGAVDQTVGGADINVDNGWGIPLLSSRTVKLRSPLQQPNADPNAVQPGQTAQAPQAQPNAAQQIIEKSKLIGKPSGVPDGKAIKNNQTGERLVSQGGVWVAG